MTEGRLNNLKLQVLSAQEQKDVKGGGSEYIRYDLNNQIIRKFIIEDLIDARLPKPANSPNFPTRRVRSKRC